MMAMTLDADVGGESAGRDVPSGAPDSPATADVSAAARFAVITDGTTQMGPGLPLDEAAQRVADGYRPRRCSNCGGSGLVENALRRKVPCPRCNGTGTVSVQIEARVVLPVGGWRPLSHAETKALAYAAALEVAR